MRTAASALLPILRSRVQGDLLALLLLHPDRQYSLTEAADRIGASVKAVHTEASRLVESGLLLEARRGNLRLISAADNLLTGPLTALMAVTYGPLPVLTDALTSVGGIDEAYIYGSWAARYLGEPGPPPADVDVLVIGTADIDDLDDAAVHAERILEREVNIRRVSPDDWADHSSPDPFLDTVRDRPLLRVRFS